MMLFNHFALGWPEFSLLRRRVLNSSSSNNTDKFRALKLNESHEGRISCSREVNVFALWGSQVLFGCAATLKHSLSRARCSRSGIKRKRWMSNERQ